MLFSSIFSAISFLVYSAPVRGIVELKKRHRGTQTRAKKYGF